MADYSEQVAVALELITEYGGLGSIRTPDGVNTPSQLLVIQGKAYIPMGGLGVVPVAGCIVVAPGGVPWQIMKADVIDPSGVQPIVAICEVSEWPTS